jgi:hypothetical protein
MAGLAFARVGCGMANIQKVSAVSVFMIGVDA